MTITIGLAAEAMAQTSHKRVKIEAATPGREAYQIPTSCQSFAPVHGSHLSATRKTAQLVTIHSFDLGATFSSGLSPMSTCCHQGYPSGASWGTWPVKLTCLF